MSYLPFRGLSAWFSCSVNPKIIQKWDNYGGTYANETSADYLFSDDAQMQDTQRIYSTQRGIVLFQTSWIMEIVQRQCQVHDVVLGQHLLCPHYLAPFKTPDLTKNRHMSNSRIKSEKPGIKTRKRKQNEGLKDFNGGGSKQTQLWLELEQKARESMMSEVVHMKNVDVDDEIVEFDCSRSEFQIKRIT